MDSKNNKTSDPDSILLNLTDKIDLRRKDKKSNLYQILAIWEKIKKSYNNNKFKISAQKIE